MRHIRTLNSVFIVTAAWSLLVNLAFEMPILAPQILIFLIR